MLRQLSNAATNFRDFLLASKLPSVQPGVAKSLIYLFLKQPQDKEHFITELLDFGTI